MADEQVTVHFPGRRGYYRVPVNDATEDAVGRLEVNRDGYHDLTVKADDERLFRHATPVTLGDGALDDREAHAEPLTSG